MSGYYVLKKSGAQFMFNLKADNNQTILTSERYTSKQSADEGITSVRTNSSVDARYERRVSASREPYFVLKASNGQIIGTSEMYSSTSAMENGIASCKVNDSTKVVKDET